MQHYVSDRHHQLLACPDIPVLLPSSSSSSSSSSLLLLLLCDVISQLIITAITTATGRFQRNYEA